MKKISLFARCLNMNFISSTTFHLIQTFYVVPSIKELWAEMKGKIWNIFQKEHLVLCGDGRMDSPGFSAKYCLYTMMDHFLDLIVDVEVVDKKRGWWHFFAHGKDGLQEDPRENGGDIKSSGGGDGCFQRYNEDGQRTER